MLSAAEFLSPESLSALSPALIFAALFFGTFISEDAACVAGGALAAGGHFPLAAAIAACFGGILAGDIAIFILGRTAGRGFTKTRFGRRLLTEDRLAAASVWLERRGPQAVFISRFVFGLRVPTYFAAGLLHTSFIKFAFYLAAAALVWTPILVVASAWSLGSGVLSGWTLAAGAIAVLVLLRALFIVISRKQRRLFAGRIGRVLRWEFWPIWIFYAPVVAYILWLGARFRRPTLFTASNPAIPHSGFVGESKAEIYRGLANSPGANGRMLPFFAFEPLKDESEHEVRARLSDALGQESAPRFPLIVKPDSGERGRGVTRVDNADELVAAVLAQSSTVIIQEFFGSVEASVFYVRHPDEPRGRIFSITEKRFPVLVGDGRSTIEELILADRRAVILAGKYFAENQSRLADIPAVGEEIKLIEIGTHSRGAIFVDGSSLLSDERLETAIDEICRGFDGFCFGRFDLRAPDFESLRSGRDFRVIELNGVTSESTNIYDPGFSLAGAYGVLFRQWRIAFEIGAANVSRGIAAATPATQLLKICARHVLGIR